VFRLRGRSPEDVTPVSTQVYADEREVAPRPAWDGLTEYVQR
jgi:hypothetical protein